MLRGRKTRDEGENADRMTIRNFDTAGCSEGPSQSSKPHASLDIYALGLALDEQQTQSIQRQVFPASNELEEDPLTEICRNRVNPLAGDLDPDLLRLCVRSGSADKVINSEFSS